MELVHFFFQPFHVILQITFYTADVAVASQVLRLSKVVLIDPFGYYHTISGTDHAIAQPIAGRFSPDGALCSVGEMW